MKLFIGYWVMGCFIIGLAVGSTVRDCPKDNIRIYEAVAAVSIWPSFVFASITAGKVEKSECKSK